MSRNAALSASDTRGSRTRSAPACASAAKTEAHADATAALSDAPSHARKDDRSTTGSCGEVGAENKSCCCESRRQSALCASF